MKYLPWTLVILLVIALCYVARYQVRNNNDQVNCDTFRYIDTIVFCDPTPKDCVIIRYKIVKLPVKRDTVVICSSYDSIDVLDSTDVIIPIQQTEYVTDTFRAWVSGYQAKLDSIHLYMPAKVITIHERQKMKRWTIGIHTGYGISPKGFVPYIGLGFTYRVFP